MAKQEPIEIYSLIQQFVKLEIDNKIQKFADQTKYNIAQVPAHGHTGVDSQRIKFSDLEGVPIYSTVPSDLPANGTLRLYQSGATIRLYAFINNNWRYVALT